jgi:hypothetical protein
MCVEEYEYKGLTIEIEQDGDRQEGPREWDNFGRMICWHRKYNLGDEHEYGDQDQFLCDLFDDMHRSGKVTDEDVRLICLAWLREDREGFKHYMGYKINGTFKESRYDLVMDEVINDYMQKVGPSVKQVVADIVQREHIMLPLYLYDHSGITMNTTGFSDKWDSGMVGVIYVSKLKAQEEFNSLKDLHERHPEYGIKLKENAEEHATAILKGEVEVYDMYLTGQVYQYTINDEDGNCLGSLCDCYGLDYTKQEAEAEADHIASTLALDFVI